MSRPSFKDYTLSLRTLGDWQGLGKTTRLLLAYGPNEFLLNRTVAMLRERTGPALNAQVTSVEATDVELEDLLAMAQQDSLFEPSTVYVLRRVEQARGLPGLLKRLSPAHVHNHLALIYRGESPPAPLRHEVTRLGGKDLPCFDPFPSEVTQAIGAIAKSHAVKLTPDATDYLARAVGPDLVKLDHELRRLAWLRAGSAADDAAMTAAELDVGLLREDEAFKIGQLLTEGRWSQAHLLVNDLLTRGESSIAILGLLAAHCRHALRITAGRRAGVASEKIASTLKAPPSVARLYAQNARSLGEPRQYRRALELCQATDFHLKSSKVPESLLLGRIIDALSPAVG